MSSRFNFRYIHSNDPFSLNGHGCGKNRKYDESIWNRFWHWICLVVIQEGTELLRYPIYTKKCLPLPLSVFFLTPIGFRT